MVIIALNGTLVLKGTKVIGHAKPFCCGVDFSINKFPNALFSITNIKKTNEDEIVKAIELILALQIPREKFHWNFNFKQMQSTVNFLAYQKKLDELI